MSSIVVSNESIQSIDQLELDEIRSKNDSKKSASSGGSIAPKRVKTDSKESKTSFDNDVVIISPVDERRNWWKEPATLYA